MKHSTEQQSRKDLRQAVKRSFDVAGSFVGLTFTGVLYLIFAPQIKHASPGPVFYSQIRIGKDGVPFRMYKFRSMYPDADEKKAGLLKFNKMDGPMFKMDDDPRIFPVGRFMRKYSLDEFPQFYNVLRGEMSIVGNRPPTIEEWETYDARYRVRMRMKPGITGLWQTSGRNGITRFEDIFALDRKYIENWNLKEDVRILLKTLPVILSGKGT